MGLGQLGRSDDVRPSEAKVARFKKESLVHAKTELEPSQKPPWEETVASFDSIGVPGGLCESLAQRLNVTKPTSLQASLLPAVLSHRDMIIRDATGSGKTLGVLVAVLSKKHPFQYEIIDAQKPYFEDPDPEIGDDASAPPEEDAGSGKWTRRVRYLATLFLTPTPELALQVYQWARVLLSDKVRPDDVVKHVQCLVPQSPLESQIDLLRSTTPRLLIGTPRRILEILQLDQEAYRAEEEACGEASDRKFAFKPAIDLTMVQTVVLDETDAQVRVETPNETEKQKRRRKANPLYAEVLMDRIMEIRRTTPEDGPIMQRRPKQEGNREESGTKEEERRKLALKPAATMTVTRLSGRDPAARRLQVVLCSATLNRNVRHELERRRAWVVDPILLDEGSNLAPKTISHRCVVYDTVKRTWRDMLTPEEMDSLKLEAQWAVDNRVEGAKPFWQQREVEMALADDDDRMLDAVAIACKEMEITRGVLLIDSAISIVKLTARLRERGIKAGRVKDTLDMATMSGLPAKTDADAQALSTLASDSGDVTTAAVEVDAGVEVSTATGLAEFFVENHLLVLCENTARGLDLPFVTHVLMLGVPPNVPSYLHMSGRVGRFGRPGTALTFLPGARYEIKMMQILKQVKVDRAAVEEKVLKAMN
ncbi:hypothetical protein HK101_010066 [Irineochytrium annulatum]|nr:hypothetical protein HK101_010066 [Irineochytrium annulatum]